jgi:hypothetical protein
VLQGSALSAVRKVMSEKMSEIRMIGRKTCLSDIPLLRIASISLLSDRSPITMLDAVRLENGKVYNRNWGIESNTS